MGSLWMKHLSTILVDHGLVPYVWDINADRFEWKGNLNAVLGVDNQDYPVSSHDFLSLLNPQYVPERLAVFHEVLELPEGDEDQPSFSISYLMRRTDGVQVNVEEKAALYTDPMTGGKILCGTLRFINSGGVLSTQNHLSAISPAISMAEEIEEEQLFVRVGNSFLRALQEDRVRLAFQPVIRAQTKEIAFYEGLVRYQDEDGKIRKAGEFIPLLERFGLIRLVDQYTLKLACRELCRFPDLSLAVNVSAQSFEDRDWLRHVVALLRDRPSVAGRLIVEITETMMSQGIENTLRTVKTLRDLGCRVALDDFGSGHTSFTQLQKLDIDIIKIDRSFVRDLHKGKNRLFVRTLQTLAESIGAEIVAEGAESAAEAEMLAQDGIACIQGYVYGEPVIERGWLPRSHVSRRIAFGNGEATYTSDDFAAVSALSAQGA